MHLAGSAARVRQVGGRLLPIKPRVTRQNTRLKSLWVFMRSELLFQCARSIFQWSLETFEAELCD